MDNLIPLRQWAQALNISPRRARELCRQGRVPGAVQMGDYSTAPWFVPADALPEPAASLKGPRPRWAEDKEPLEMRDEFDDALLRRFEEGYTLEIEVGTLYSGAADEDADEMPEIIHIQDVFTEAELEELKQVFSEKRRKKAGI